MSAEEKSMSIIVTKGSLDWAYPPFILATTAAAMGLPVTLFFTFYGLPLLLKDLKLQVTAAKFSASAKAKIEAAGGEITEVAKVKWTRQRAAEAGAQKKKKEKAGNA